MIFIVFSAFQKRLDIIKLYGAQKYNLAVEKGLFKRLDWEDIQVSFIISTGRTGTKFLSDIFNRASNTTSLHEPMPSFLELANDYARGIISFDANTFSVPKGTRLDRTLLFKLNYCQENLNDVFITSEI